MLQRYFQVTCLPAKWSRRHLVYQKNNVDVIARALNYVIIIEHKISTNHRQAIVMNTNKTKLSLYFNPKRNDKYRIDILPKTMVDFQGETNDTLQFNLKTLDIV